MSKLSVAIVLAVVCVVASAALPQDNEKDLINYINKIDNEKSLYLFGGLRVDRIDNGRSFASKADNFVDRVEGYMQNHELNFDWSEDSEEDNAIAGRSNGESRNKRLRRMLLPLLLVLKLKKALIFKVLFMVVKFISLKALAISFLALIFSGATLFKDLIHKKKDHITTAYITGAPVNADIVHSDWNRNGQAAAQELAYNYHAMPQAGVY